MFLLSGWLIPFAIAGLFIGRWIIDIVIPTLKGGNFNALYDFHQIRYLDITLLCSVVGFLWLSFVVVKLAKQASQEVSLA